MAIPAWLIVNPTLGSGNASVSISALEYTGRVYRYYNLKVKTQTLQEIVGVGQAAKPLFLTVGDKTVSSDGGSVLITGKSNGEGVAFMSMPTSGDVNVQLTLPTSYIAAGITVNMGTPIPGDPGASNEYDFSLTVDFPKNETTKQRKAAIYVSSGGVSEMVYITQYEGVETLSTDPISVGVNYLGEDQVLNIISNTDWEIE